MSGADKPMWMGIDHVQLAMPAGAEEVARGFYAGLLGIPEVPKPGATSARGGCWFEAGEVRLHLGVDHDFRPARRAHPALVVVDVRDLVDRLALDVVWADDVPGVVRCHLFDPFGNRIELVEHSP